MMNKMIILMIMSLINILFLNFNNPMIMGILLLLQTFLLVILMGKIFYSFWFSYIIFLVFIGGLFILFIYMISLIYNNKFYVSKNYFFFFMLFLIFLNFKNQFFNNYETNLFKMLIIEENKLNTIKFYNFPNNYINMMLIIYLFLLMIIVVKITNFFMGPIRNN